MGKERKENGSIDYLAAATVDVDKRLEIFESSKMQEERTAELASLNAELLRELAESRQREIVLRESEKQYRQLIDDSPVGHMMVDLSGNIQFFNRQIEEYLGCKCSDMIGKNAYDLGLIDDGTRQLLRKRLAARLAGASTQIIGFPILRDNGEHSWVELKASFLMEGGLPVSLHLAFVDVTERKKVVDALRDSEKLYRSVIENINDTFYRANTNGKLMMVSPSATKLIGYNSADDMIGWDIAESIYYHPADREIFLREMKEKRGVTDYELILKHQNGNPVNVSTSSHYYHDEQGNILGIEGVLRDITERKQTEDALKEREQFLRLVTDNIQDAIRVVDLKTLQYTYSNPYVEKLFGLRPTDYQAMPMGSHLDDDNRQKLLQIIQDELAHDAERAANRSKLIELKEKNIKTGQIVWTENKASFMRDDKGEPKAVLSITRDITERKKAEEERMRLQERLRRAEKMEVLGTLAGGVAHDLNNMLGGLVGYPELILRQLPQDSPLRKSILTMQKSGEKAAAVVQDLLTMARRGVTSMETISFNQVIREYLKTPEHEKMCCFHPNIRVNIQLANDLPLIRGSAVHLSKTVMNLLSNAMEAMPEGGVITLTTHNQYIDRPVHEYDDVKEGDYVILSVADTGEGIPQENIEKIFEPFYTKKIMGRSGTGLGLAVVWGTVKDHAGYIDVQSREGEGSTFTLFFPATREKQLDACHPLAQADYKGEGESILVVDDVPEQREMAAAMLASLNYRVTLAPSGEAALEQAKLQKFDLLLLDMIMNPGLDGLETYRQISGIYPRQKAVIVSGFSETERVGEVQKLGAGAYVRKPYTLEKLGKAVRKELVKREA